MIPFLYYVEISHYNTRLKKNLAFYENTYIYTKNNKGYKLFDHFFVFYSYFFRFFPTFSDIFFYGPMEKGFECLIIFTNQKSIKQFSRYELKKKATVLVYILENDRYAPVHYIHLLFVSQNLRRKQQLLSISNAYKIKDPNGNKDIFSVRI